MKHSDEKTRKLTIDVPVNNYKLEHDEYLLSWNTYEIPEHSLRRQINWIVDKNGNIVNNIAFLQYTLPSHVACVHFQPKPHGNSKRCEPFHGKLTHSTLSEIKNKVTEKPSTVMREFHEKDSLMTDPLSLPSAKSVYNCRSRQKAEDPLQEMLEYNTELEKNIIIGQHGQPGITLVFQTEQMKRNARFLEKGSVIQVDTTFGQHNFYVTNVGIQDKSFK